MALSTRRSPFKPPQGRIHVTARRALRGSIAVLSLAGRLLASEGPAYWNEFKLKRSLDKDLDAHVKLEQRWASGLDQLVLHNYAVGIVSKITNYIDLEVNYKFETEKGSTEWTEENRLELTPILTFERGEHIFKIRSRIELRSFEREKKWRLREKFGARTRIQTGALEFTPFVSEEIFYDLRVSRFSQNRVMIGIATGFMKRGELRLYYLFKSNRRDEKWVGGHIFGTEFATGL